MWPFSDPKIAQREFKRLVIRVPNPLGDMVMATSALDALRERYPDTHLTGHGTRLAEEIYAGGGWFDEFMVVGRRESVFQQGRDLRAGNFDACLLLAGSMRTSLPPFLARIPSRIGYRWSGRTILLTAHFRRPRPGGKQAAYPTKHYFQDLIKNLGCDARYARPIRLALSDDDKRETDRWLSSFGVASDAPILALAVGAGFGPSKIWPTDRFAEIADTMVERHGACPLVLCGPNETEVGDRVTAAMRHTVPNAAAMVLPTAVLKGVCARARVMLCNDIGPRHVAAAFNRPIVCLMGPTDPIYSETDMGNQMVLLAEGVDCMPCHLKVCPIDHRCMTRIETDRVLPHVEAAWQTS